MSFWGRAAELDRLASDLDAVRRTGRGRMVAIRGRRQAGKSRLLAEFVARADVPYLFTTAVKNAAPAAQLATVMADLPTARTPLPDHGTAFAAPATTWSDLLARLPLAIGDGPVIVVLDEFPWAVETDETLEGVLQNAWDRTLEELPILVVLVGSDLAMMERLTEHDRPLYGRTHERLITPLSPSGTADAFDADRPAVDLLDVYLATGGYPRLVCEAARFDSASAFVNAQFADDASPLLVTGQRVLAAEFRDAESARTVLEAIGSVERGHATFSSAVGHLAGDDKVAGTQVSRALAPLQAKRMVTVEVPVGAPDRTKLRRYRITDPYLRFWLRFCAPEQAHIERGRADLAVARFERDFPSWRGRSIEPVVHAAISSLAASGDERFTDVDRVGSWWDRTNQHEYDVAAAGPSGQVSWLGSIKWRTGRPMAERDLSALAEGRGVVPHAAAARLLAVCPAGVEDAATFDAVLDASEVLRAV